MSALKPVPLLQQQQQRFTKLCVCKYVILQLLVLSSRTQRGTTLFLGHTGAAYRRVPCIILVSVLCKHAFVALWSPMHAFTTYRYVRTMHAIGIVCVLINRGRMLFIMAHGFWSFHQDFQHGVVLAVGTCIMEKTPHTAPPAPSHRPRRPYLPHGNRIATKPPRLEVSCL